MKHSAILTDPLQMLDSGRNSVPLRLFLTGLPPAPAAVRCRPPQQPTDQRRSSVVGNVPIDSALVQLASSHSVTAPAPLSIDILMDH